MFVISTERVFTDSHHTPHPAHSGRGVFCSLASPFLILPLIGVFNFMEHGHGHGTWNMDMDMDMDMDME